MAPFCGWGSAASRLELLRGDSFFLITKFSEMCGTYFTKHGGMKG